VVECHADTGLDRSLRNLHTGGASATRGRGSATAMRKSGSLSAHSRYSVKQRYTPTRHVCHKVPKPLKNIEWHEACGFPPTASRGARRPLFPHRLQRVRDHSMTRAAASIIGVMPFTCPLAHAATPGAGAHSWPIVMMIGLLVLGIGLMFAVRARRVRRRTRFDLWLLSRPESRVLPWRRGASSAGDADADSNPVEESFGGR